MPGMKTITYNQLLDSCKSPVVIKPCKYFSVNDAPYKKIDELQKKIGTVLLSVKLSGDTTEGTIGFNFSCQVNCNGEVGNWSVSAPDISPYLNYPEIWGRFVAESLRQLTSKIKTFDGINSDLDLRQGALADFSKGKVSATF